MNDSSSPEHPMGRKATRDMLSPVLEAFAQLGTIAQLNAIRRAGVETHASDMALGYLAGHYPLKYEVLIKRLEMADKYGYAAAA